MMNNPTKNTERLSVVDSLRGFALFAILILHNVMHYSLYFIPENQPHWLYLTNKVVMHTIMFFVAGKAYMAFSLLFGFSFFIQLRNERGRGGDFFGRFAWRMCLLFLFSQFHALFYSGDILLMYSIIGLLLIPFSTLSNKTVLIIAFIFMLQPIEWGRILYSVLNSDYLITQNYLTYSLRETMINGSFIEALKANLSDGQLGNIIYYFETGRMFQTIALFMLGMLLGRYELFVKSVENTKKWQKILKYASIFFVSLFLIKTVVANVFNSGGVTDLLNIILSSYSNFAFTGVLIGIFVIMWFKKDGYRIQKLLIPFGRMSLTSYIFQSIIGVFIYYGFGLGLYEYTGAVASVVIAMVIFIIQLIFSQRWLDRHKQGPLEYIWRCGTWLNRSKFNK